MAKKKSSKRKHSGNNSKTKPKHLRAIQTASKLHQSGKHQEAADAYLAVLKEEPDNFTANLGLGLLLNQLNQINSALPYFQKAAENQPESFEANWYLAIAQRLSGQLPEAQITFEKLYSMKPSDEAVLINLGTLYMDRNHPYKAEKLLDKALLINPDNADALIQKGLILKTQGEIEQARNSYKKAINIEPNKTEAYRGLADLGKFTEHNEEVASMEKLFNRIGLPNQDKMLLGYALAKVYDDLSDHRKAFETLKNANDLNRQSYNYSIPFQHKLFHDHIENLNQDFIQRFENKGLQDNTPIFIVGMPRSGTSLVEQILASHSKVHGAGEVDYLRCVTEACSEQSGQPFPLGIEKASEETLVNAAKHYIEQLREGVSDDKIHVTDKLPHNFLRVGLIAAVLPNAKIIHCTRNPIDNCLSIYQQYFVPAHGYASKLDELGQYYLLYNKLMKFWAELLPGKILEVNYEQMVENQEDSVRKLLQHCELDFEQSCVDFHKTRRNVNTPSATQVRKPIYKAAMEKWKKYEEELAPLVNVLKKLD